jgi:hypoxanthine phosphoribosyltransferase
MHERYSLLADEESVSTTIAAMASHIHSDFPDTLPVFVALLRGAAPFATSLMHELVKQQRDSHPEIDYMMVSTYGDTQHAGQPRIVTDLAPTTSLRERSVIILDDVLDKGITAEFVTRHLLSRGANTVRLAVLCDKQTTRTHAITADYAGFTFTDNWLVGMGMDDAEAALEGYRWLPEIWEIKR